MSSKAIDVSLSGANSSEEGCELVSEVTLAGESSFLGAKNRLKEVCRRNGRADFGRCGLVPTCFGAISSTNILA